MFRTAAWLYKKDPPLHSFVPVRFDSSMEFAAAVCGVWIAGHAAVLGWEPYEADVTEAVRRGLPINVTVEGTHTNVFGPLHELPKPAYACGPGSFMTEGDAWTDEYSLLDSGLRGFTFKAQKTRGGD